MTYDSMVLMRASKAPTRPHLFFWISPAPMHPLTTTPHFSDGIILVSFCRTAAVLYIGIYPYIIDRACERDLISELFNAEFLFVA